MRIIIASERFLNYPNLGVGQGNAAGQLVLKSGPQIWSLNLVHYGLNRKLGYGGRLTSALTQDILHLCRFRHVDGCDVIETANSPAIVSERI